MSLADLTRKINKTEPSKVSVAYLIVLCKRYGLKKPRDVEDHLLLINGAYKGILKKIDGDYALFEKFIRNYILINRTLSLMGKETTCHQIVNISFIKNHLNLFRTAIRIIDRSRDDIDYIELKFKLEEEIELGEN